MIRLTLLITLFTTSAFATPSCPTAADALSPGILVTFDDGLISRFSVSKDGIVTEDLLDDEVWRYESIGSVFLLRNGPLGDGKLNPEEIEITEYRVPLGSLPAMVEGTNWQGHVSYIINGKTVWETDMAVVASAYPDLQIGDCTYEAILLTISEPDEGGSYTTFLAFLPTFGFGIQIGAFSQWPIDRYTPVLIERVGDE